MYFTVSLSSTDLDFADYLLNIPFASYDEARTKFFSLYSAFFSLQRYDLVSKFRLRYSYNNNLPDGLLAIFSRRFGRTQYTLRLSSFQDGTLLSSF